MQPLWQPSADRIARSAMTALRNTVNTRYEQQLGDYDALWQWSIDHPAEFWHTVWDECCVLSHTPWRRVVDDVDRLPGARWFEGATLNYAEHLLRYARDPAHAHRTAIVYRDEGGTRRTLSFTEIDDQSARFAAYLASTGVTAGDVVAGYLPNQPETVIAMLGATRLGATWTSCSPDFGIQGVLDRFGQVNPRVLVSVRQTTYGGKTLPLADRVIEIARQLPSLKQVVLIGEDSQADGQTDWHRVLRDTPPLTDFVAVPFDAPLYIMFSSGTTGVPKCIVHGVGGTLLQHLKEHRYHCDLSAGDVFFYYTTCGWMMWNWLVSGLASGTTLVLFDGSPFHPVPEVLVNLIDEEGINVFGVGAKYLSSLEKAGIKPHKTHTLQSLRTILSTGSPLSPESFDYVYRDIKTDVCLASISGGTDIISCFVLGNPVLPVFRGELQCRGLGMAVDIVDESAQPLRGEKGELICRRAFPSSPTGFLSDPDGKKFRAAYFERFPGLWAHGDYGEITANGGMVIHGRSDAVLNPGGVRIGTAEIYRQVEKVDAVLESIAVSQTWGDDVRIVLFVRLRDGIELDDALRNDIKRVIRDNASPRHVPAKILQVADIPRTVSGKIVELAVRNVIHGEPVKNTEALANPQALALFRDRPELQTP